MAKFEQTYSELVEKSKEFGEFVKKNQGEYNAEDLATLKSLGENWIFVSQSGDKTRLKNSAGLVFEFDIKTHHFTRIINEEEREEIERKWPKVPLQ